MKKKLSIFFLQIKLAFKSLPVILLGMSCFAGLIVLMAFAGNKMLGSDTDNSKMNIALVMNDDSTLMDMAVSFVLQEDVVEEMCNLQEMTEEEALEALKRGEIIGVLIIPPDYLTGILNGTNVPARIILADAGDNSQSAVFREMIDSAITDIATAQSAIYAAGDLCNVTGYGDAAECMNYLNRTLLMYALGRNEYYETDAISEVGDLPVMWFYVAGGIVLLLLFSGIICGEMFKKENDALNVSLKRSGLSMQFMALAKLTGVSLVFFVILCMAYVVAAIAGIIKVSVVSLPGLAVLVITVFSINLLIFQMIDNKAAAALVNFIVTVLMMFLSGNIMPEIFLPNIVNKIGMVMPTGWLVDLCGQIMLGSVRADTILICSGYGILFVAMTMIYLNVQERRKG